MKKAFIPLLLALALCLTAAGSTQAVMPFPGEVCADAGIPADILEDSVTCAFPVSGVTSIEVLNENARPVLFHTEEGPGPIQAYVVYDDTAFLHIETAASDNPACMICYDSGPNSFTALSGLLDPHSGVYLYDAPMPGAQETRHYTCFVLLDSTGTVFADVCLIAGDEYIEELADDLRSLGYTVAWEDAETAPAEHAVPQAYILHVVGQDGMPVPETIVTFCTDAACVMRESDESGTISFSGTPDDYHVKIVEVPDGYSFDGDFELYTGRGYGEWVLRIRKD